MSDGFDFHPHGRLGQRRNLTSVLVGKSPAKNSRRARQTFSRCVMSVTKMVIFTTSRRDRRRS
jgi:hypothetical protein